MVLSSYALHDKLNIPEIYKKMKRKKDETVKRVRSLHGILVRAEYLLVHLFPHGDTHCCGIILI